MTSAVTVYSEVREGKLEFFFCQILTRIGAAMRNEKADGMYEIIATRPASFRQVILEKGFSHLISGMYTVL